MGIDWHTARFLIGARESGVDFGRTATLGRQNLMVSSQDLRELFDEFNASPLVERVVTENSEFADDFFRALGAKTYVPIDASNYEGAVEVHDMNFPIPDRLRNAFDTVVDGGTLEHVFNFPTAIRNCMEMVRVGGHLLITTPTNNYCGHGFYQFSPELLFRVLSPENGFRVERMIAYEVYPHSQWYDVTDPAQHGARVEIVGSDHRVLLTLRAQRIEEKAILRNPPQQSDYTVIWSDAPTGVAKQAPYIAAPKQPGLMRWLAWKTLKALHGMGPAGRRAVVEQRTRFFNRQYHLTNQPGVFRATER
jgi:SAM-dependent methyltransferase